ncbi:MAG: carotenoid 1,2-hydratase [Deltaproteobacteria bacterium]|nr:carotenoid 1,2-hydratase [Deltaproteobacteria bacterium]MBW1951530.1 carotenoid 1,2-hydratase [Deltaproteobacteria bacterium]
MGALIAALILVLGWVALAAGGDFKMALPGRPFQFPQDHAAHPDFKTEWWYYTGHLEAIDGGERFGYELTFFRVGLKKPDPEARSAWALHTLYFAHLALTDINRGTFFYKEKVGRGALGMSGAATDRYRVWINDWQVKLHGQIHQLQARSPELTLALSLSPEKPLVVHGADNISQKAEGAGFASHYYSFTRLATQGQLTYHGRTIPVRGESWMDHEFSSSHLKDYQVGWDWFALQLADGQEIMLYLLRHRDGGVDPHSSGTLVDAQGRGRHLKLADFQVRTTATWQSQHSGARYPAGWQIAIPQSGYKLKITPTVADQELVTTLSTRITYWEGSVRVIGTRFGQPVSGQGYVELTGYATPLGGKF